MQYIWISKCVITFIFIFLTQYYQYFPNNILLKFHKYLIFININK